MRALRVVAVALAAATGVLGLRIRRAHRTARTLSGAAPCITTDDGVRLHVEVAGPADAPATVVLVHGFGARAAMFDPQWAALRGNVRVARYDQRGHGASGWAGFRSTTPDRLGRDLGQVLDELGGPGPVVVVGHSMGGMAVLALAGQRPELFGDRIAGVALLSSLAAPLAVGGRDLGGLAALLRRSLASAGAWALWLAAPAVDAVHPFRSGPGRRVLRRGLFAADPPDDAAREMTDMWARTPTAVLTAYLTGLAGYDQRRAVDVLRGLPVLVLAGTDDTTIPPASGERLAERIGGTARLLLVPGAGHMVTLTHADAVDAALLDLLGRAGTDVRQASDGAG
ncbi:alpha/beta fold hydrolase [Modestobacter lapidis]|nr:alpha/beta hydrolase [Modestobacter lapidis]